MYNFKIEWVRFEIPGIIKRNITWALVTRKIPYNMGEDSGAIGEAVNKLVIPKSWVEEFLKSPAWIALQPCLVKEATIEWI